MVALKRRRVRKSFLSFRLTNAGIVTIGLAVGLSSGAFAAEKPPLMPDTIAPFTTNSRISATVEFALSALASEVEHEIPRRISTISERISCVHRRVFVFNVNADCDIYGYVDRSGPVSLYGRGDAIYGSVPIDGVLEGEGANRFTSRIHGETEASATVEARARPRLNRDWSLDLNFSDGFRWSEPPVLHVLGREISIVKYAEPRMRDMLVQVGERARAAAMRLDLQDKVASAWRFAFTPLRLSDKPEVWLQLTPQNVAFAGVRADTKILSGAVELSGSATTFVGQAPPVAPPTAFPPLGNEVAQPGSFDVILPIRIGYDLLKDKIMQVSAMAMSATGMSLREADIYPSSGKLVVGLRIAKASETDAAAGQWVYLTAGIHVDADGHAVRLIDLAAVTGSEQLASVIDPVIAQLRTKANVDYGIAYQNLLNAANEKLTRPLTGQFRMEGRLTSMKLENVYLPVDGVVIALRASGDLKITYGM